MYHIWDEQLWFLKAFHRYKWSIWLVVQSRNMANTCKHTQDWRDDANYMGDQWRLWQAGRNIFKRILEAYNAVLSPIRGPEQSFMLHGASPSYEYGNTHHFRS